MPKPSTMFYLIAAMSVIWLLTINIKYGLYASGITYCIAMFHMHFFGNEMKWSSALYRENCGNEEQVSASDNVASGQNAMAVSCFARVSSKEEFDSSTYYNKLTSHFEDENTNLQEDLFCNHDDYFFNPANGLPMMIGGIAGVDIEGNLYGTDSHNTFFDEMYESDYDLHSLDSTIFDTIDSGDTFDTFDSFDSTFDDNF